MVVAHFLLLGIEANALAYDGGLRAGGAPDGKGHFETDGQNALARLASTGAEGVLARDGVGGEDALLLRGHITAHVWWRSSAGVRRRSVGSVGILKPCILADGEIVIPKDYSSVDGLHVCCVVRLS